MLRKLVQNGYKGDYFQVDGDNTLLTKSVTLRAGARNGEGCGAGELDDFNAPQSRLMVVQLRDTTWRVMGT